MSNKQIAFLGNVRATLHLVIFILSPLTSPLHPCFPQLFPSPSPLLRTPAHPSHLLPILLPTTPQTLQLGCPLPSASLPCLPLPSLLPSPLPSSLLSSSCSPHLPTVPSTLILCPLGSDLDFSKVFSRGHHFCLP